MCLFRVFCIWHWFNTGLTHVKPLQHQLVDCSVLLHEVCVCCGWWQRVSSVKMCLSLLWAVVKRVIDSSSSVVVWVLCTENCMHINHLLITSMLFMLFVCDHKLISWCYLKSVKSDFQNKPKLYIYIFSSTKTRNLMKHWCLVQSWLLERR